MDYDVGEASDGAGEVGLKRGGVLWEERTILKKEDFIGIKSMI